MKRLLFVILFVGVGCAHKAKPPSEVEIIRASIKEKGAKQTVADLNANPARWNAVVQSVLDGKSEWLQLAVELRAGTDAGTSEDLSSAVTGAIKNNPKGVMALVADPQSGFSFDQTCMNPLIEPTPEEARSYDLENIQALRRVTGTNKDLAERCAKKFETPSPGTRYP